MRLPTRLSARHQKRKVLLRTATSSASTAGGIAASRRRATAARRGATASSRAAGATARDSKEKGWDFLNRQNFEIAILRGGFRFSLSLLFAVSRSLLEYSQIMYLSYDRGVTKMHSFFRKNGWKTTILKMKIRKKAHGIMLLTTSLAVLTWILITQAFFLMNSSTINTIQTERVASQAVQNAQLDRSMYQENSRCTNTRCPWELSVSEDFFVSRQMDTPWAS